MIPAGYMAKRLYQKPDYLKAEQVRDIYSVSGCVSSDFADYIPRWKHNGYWLFDSPEIIREVAIAESATLEGTLLFFYEVYEQQFDGERWHAFSPQPFPTSIVIPQTKHIEGFDIVTFYAGTSPECSPLSCNGMAREIPTNEHCLIDSFEEAKAALVRGDFKNAEPGPYRIFAVYSVDSPWP